MYKKLLHDAGLSLNEAEIYEYLLKNGESSAADIIKNTSLKKGMAYLELDNLVQKKLISKKMLKPKNPNIRNKTKIAYFSPQHPEKLRDVISNQETAIQTAKNNFDANFKEIVSDFNLISGKPGIQVFEGIEGIKRILNDSLTATETIRSYANTELLFKYVGELNKEYIKKRIKLEIKKRGLVPDTPFTRKNAQTYHTDITDVRIMKKSFTDFKSSMQIYDNKVTYINFTPNAFVSIIIHDPEIYAMNCAIFEHAWETAEIIPQETVPKK